MNGIRKKARCALLLGIVLCLTLLGFELYTGAADRHGAGTGPDADSLSPAEAKNLNLIAVQRIQQGLAGRSSFSFVVLGDNRDNPETFRQILKDAARHNPDFIIHTGDFTEAGDKQEYLEAVGLMRECGRPFVVIPGNHDLERADGVQNFLDIFGPLDFYFNVGHCRFICINDNSRKYFSGFADIAHDTDRPAARSGQKGSKHDDGLRMFADVLDQSGKNFIILHKPPRIEPFTFHSFSKNADIFLNLVKKNAAHISAVFCGHVHGYGEARIGSVLCVAAGGAGAPLHTDRKGIDSRFNYILVSIEKDEVRQEVFFIH